MQEMQPRALNCQRKNTYKKNILNNKSIHFRA